jgi:hypothetical protein
VDVCICNNVVIYYATEFSCSDAEGLGGSIVHDCMLKYYER